MSHPIFRIAEAFLETAIDDVEYWVNNANVPPAEGTCITGVEIKRSARFMARRRLALGATHAAIDRGPRSLRDRAERAAKHGGSRRLAAARRIGGIGEDRR